MPSSRTLTAWLVLVPCAVFCAFRLFGWDDFYPATQLMAYAPYVAAASVIPVVFALLLRQWVPAGVAGLVLVLFATTLLPRMTSDRSPVSPGTELRVMSANLLEGSADPVALLNLVKQHSVDVLTLQEYTPEFEAKFQAAGVDGVLAYHVAYAKPSVIGSAVYARYPLADKGLRNNPPDFGQAIAEMTVDGRVFPIESVHTRSPSDRQATPWWTESFGIQPPADPNGPPRILAGDFNATLDHSPMRALLATGYRDTADVLGRGLTPTWPYDGRWLPPVTLDHILADKRIGVEDYAVVGRDGSDHRPVFAILTLPQ
jgi:endonuclease/exonuclease/phosphatase (EEP) superfamily protein YafD